MADITLPDQATTLKAVMHTQSNALHDVAALIEGLLAQVGAAAVDLGSANRLGCMALDKIRGVHAALDPHI